MQQRQSLFYATASDLSDLLSKFEQAERVQYVRSGLFRNKNFEMYESYQTIPDFGQAFHPTAIANPIYLVSELGQEIIAREVAQRSGEVFFAIDQQVNDDTITLAPAGRFGNDVILGGTVGTISNSSKSASLFALLVKILRTRFRRNGPFLVGQEAWECRRAGVRLTMGANSPTEFDLKPPVDGQH